MLFGGVSKTKIFLYLLWSWIFSWNTFEWKTGILEQISRNMTSNRNIGTRIRKASNNALFEFYKILCWSSKETLFRIEPNNSKLCQITAVQSHLQLKPVDNWWNVQHDCLNVRWQMKLNFKQNHGQISYALYFYKQDLREIMLSLHIQEEHLLPVHLPKKLLWIEFCSKFFW